jgi:hypothetical protein
MIYFLALIPATALTIAGYFVLFLSTRAEGPLRTFGRYLGFWAFTLAALVILGAIFAAAHHAHHRDAFGMRGMHGRMHGPWSQEPGPGERMRPHGGEGDEPGGAPAPPGAVPSPSGSPNSPASPTVH